MSSVTLKNIVKVYGIGKAAVDDFNIFIKDKEFVVIVGPSGCGKSTLFQPGISGSCIRRAKLH